MQIIVESHHLTENNVKFSVWWWELGHASLINRIVKNANTHEYDKKSLNFLWYFSSITFFSKTKRKVTRKGDFLFMIKKHNSINFICLCHEFWRNLWEILASSFFALFQQNLQERKSWLKKLIFNLFDDWEWCLWSLWWCYFLFCYFNFTYHKSRIVKLKLYLYFSTIN